MSQILYKQELPEAFTMIFYYGVEKIFERITLNIDEILLADKNWHSDVLVQMTKPANECKKQHLKLKNS